MKKFFIFCFSMFVVSTFAALIPWKSTDASALNDAKAIAVSKNDKVSELTIDTLIAINNGSVTNFNQLSNKVDEVFKDYSDQYRITKKKQICYGREVYLNDAYQFSIKNPDRFDMYWYRKSNLFGFTKDKIVDEISNVLITYRWSASSTIQISRSLDIIFENISCKSDADAKKILTDLNRKFTAYLVKDKKSWEPVVARIRTQLETY